MRFTLKDYQSDAVGDVLRSLANARDDWHRKRRPCRRHEGQLEDSLVALPVRSWTRLGLLPPRLLLLAEDRPGGSAR